MLNWTSILYSAALLVAAELFYYWIIYPAFISSLRKLPKAHPTCSISPAWILSQRWRGRENKSLDEAHKKLGPVIRLGPREVSINCVDGGIRTVYSGGFEKHNWYATIFNNYGIPNMFSTIHSKPHSERKRMLAHIYSKSYLQSSDDMEALSKEIIHGRLLPILRSHAASEKPLEIFDMWNGTTMDFITAYIFGLRSSTNFLEEPEKRQHWMALYQSRKSPKLVFWQQELPNFTKWLARFQIRLVPSWVGKANEELESWCLDMCDDVSHGLGLAPESQDSTISISPGDSPVVYRTLYDALTKQAIKNQVPHTKQYKSQLRLDIASEMIDHLAAGHETTAMTLTYFVHRLSKHPNLQSLLRRELLTLPQPLLIARPNEKLTLPSLRDIDALPLLQALIQETLRVTPPIPGAEPRVTPPDGCFLGPPDSPIGQYFVPGNVRISASPYALHRNPLVFPEAEEWRPDRWLDDSLSSPGSRESQREKKERWWWAFGSGGRMCVGSNFAMLEMKMLIAALYTTFKTTVLEGQEEGMTPLDGYMGGPQANKLWVKIDRWEENTRPDSAVSMRSVGTT